MSEMIGAAPDYASPTAPLTEDDKAKLIERTTLALARQAKRLALPAPAISRENCQVSGPHYNDINGLWSWYLSLVSDNGGAYGYRYYPVSDRVRRVC